MADGFGEVRRLAVELTHQGGRVGARAAQVVRRTAAAIEADAKALAPVDTGNLRNSITTVTQGDGRHATFTASIGPTANYGVHLEYGTSRMAPRPFMGPAAQRHEAAFVQALQQAGGIG